LKSTHPTPLGGLDSQLANAAARLPSGSGKLKGDGWTTARDECKERSHVH
jgi:hypothetical protein